MERKDLIDVERIDKLSSEIDQALIMAMKSHRNDRMANEWEFRGYYPKEDAVESNLMLVREKLHEVLAILNETLGEKKTLN